MDRTPSTFAEIISLWRTSDLATKLKVKDVTVRAWRWRGIPAEYWAEIEREALDRGFHQITVGLLADIAARQAGRPTNTESPAAGTDAAA